MLKLTIRTDNDAFQPSPYEEIARIMQVLARAIEHGTRGAPIFDINGNLCGRFDITGGDDD